jgi:hypothetical protein
MYVCVLSGQGEREGAHQDPGRRWLRTGGDNEMPPAEWGGIRKRYIIYGGEGCRGKWERSTPPPPPPADYLRVGGCETRRAQRRPCGHCPAADPAPTPPPPETCAVRFPPCWPAMGPPLTYLNWQLKRHSNCY